VNGTALAVTFRGEGTDTLEIDVYDDIGESWFSPGVTAKAVQAKLKANPKAKVIKGRMNSNGGDVFDAFAIYSALKDHPARVEFDVDAIAASAASVILMAADERRIASGAMVMIHNAWGGAAGTPADLRTHADLLEKLSAQIVDIYAARTGLEAARIKELMDATTWMTGEEAKELGFVDTVKPNKAATQALARISLAGLSRAPEAFRAAVAMAQAAPQPTTPPSPARADQTTTNPSNGKEADSMKNLIQVLALSEDADEAAVVAAVKKIQTSARVGAEVEKLVGANGDAALGAVRALKEAKERGEDLALEVGKVKATLARQSFEAARDAGLKDRKLTPAVAKMYSDRFEATLASGEDGSNIVADLQGFLAVAPRVVSAPIAGPGGVITDPKSLQHNGKTFAELTPIERHNLKSSDPELYALMRKDWEANDNR
jgi:ATP-dependent Clp protease, protease subunit